MGRSLGVLKDESYPSQGNLKIVPGREQSLDKDPESWESGVHGPYPWFNRAAGAVPGGNWEEAGEDGVLSEGPRESSRSLEA